LNVAGASFLYPQNGSFDALHDRSSVCVAPLLVIAFRIVLEQIRSCSRAATESISFATLTPQHLAQRHSSGSLVADSKQEETIGNQSFVRIFVVDDFAEWRHYIPEKLREDRSFEVVGVAADGLDAVLKAEEMQPDLILLDIGLPKPDGIEAAREIRKVAPDAKIIFLGQENDSDLARAALGISPRGYVVKSDAGSELLPAVHTVMIGKRFGSRSLAGHAFTNLEN
jgi:CheY-like chemotaxis protein